MLCESCQQQQATVHMQQIVNGIKTEHHLCQECASHSESPLSFDQFFQGLINVFAMAHDQEESLASDLSPNLTDSQEQVLRCPVCSMTFKDFKNTGKLGCAHCYSTFSREMDAILKNVQGSSLHQGKFPHRSEAVLLTGRKIENLRATLATAVENEQYEEAARLRDMIRALEVTLSEKL